MGNFHSEAHSWCLYFSYFQLADFLSKECLKLYIKMKKSRKDMYNKIEITGVNQLSLISSFLWGLCHGAP